MTALKINALSKSYASFSLDNVSFEVPQGSVMGFVGKNGAGKSTAIKACFNIIPRDGGSVEVFGKNYFENENECKKDIGIVLGGIDFYLKKRLKKISEITASFYPGAWDRDKYKKYMRFFDIDENKKADELSDGMRIKYMLCLALSHEARLLVLDEPTSGLDPVARDELCLLFSEIVKSGERSILFSSHITSDLEKCATHITFIKNGRILKSLPKPEFMKAFGEYKDMPDNPTLEDIIVCVERREIHDGVFD